MVKSPAQKRCIGHPDRVICQRHFVTVRRVSISIGQFEDLFIGGKRIVKNHETEARDQPVIGLFRRSCVRHFRNFKGGGALIGRFAAMLSRRLENSAEFWTRLSSPRRRQTSSGRDWWSTERHYRQMQTQTAFELGLSSHSQPCSAGNRMTGPKSLVAFSLAANMFRGSPEKECAWFLFRLRHIVNVCYLPSVSRFEAVSLWFYTAAR
jgi:hypothetical protein